MVSTLSSKFSTGAQVTITHKQNIPTWGKSNPHSRSLKAVPGDSTQIWGSRVHIYTLLISHVLPGTHLSPHVSTPGQVIPSVCLASTGYKNGFQLHHLTESFPRVLEHYLRLRNGDSERGVRLPGQPKQQSRQSLSQLPSLHHSQETGSTHQRREGFFHVRPFPHDITFFPSVKAKPS